ncbi:MAG: hypothetical protein ACP5OB_08455 [Candidatus Ratteibacteria bacterium]
MLVKEIIQRYKSGEKDKVFPFSEWYRRDVFEKLIKEFLKILGYNPDQINYDVEKAVIEYGLRRKIEEYEFDEEAEEIKGKFDWHLAGEGKIKDKVAIEFLAKILEKEKRISKARQKTIWQKIAEAKVPEFNQEVKEGFLRFKSAQDKAKELDEKITKIDRQ